MDDRRSLKARIQAGETLYGAFVMIPSPAVVEMFGYAGFDFVILDREHGATGLETLEHELRAAEASGLHALVRIPSRMPWEVLSVLDAGATGLVVPHVKTAEEAQAIVQAAHYPPFGKRGIATTARAGRHGLVSLKDHLRRAAENTIVMVQIEDAEALPHVQEILSTPGVDAVFIGPADLAMSLGHPGEFAHPEVASAIDRIIEAAKAAKGPVVASFAGDKQAVVALRKKGVRLICLSGTGVLSSRLRELAEELIVR